MDVSEAKVAEHGFLLWLMWTLATGVAMLFGLVVFIPFVDSVSLGLARILVPIVAGFSVGLLQWLVLRPFLANSVDWVFNGGAAWSMAYALALVVVQALNQTPVGAFVGYLVFGAVIATIQWPVLRREIRHVLPWALTNVIAWAVGSYAGEALLNLIVKSDVVSQALSSAVISGTTGLVAGALTGAALVWTVRKPDFEFADRDPSQEVTR